MTLGKAPLIAFVSTADAGRALDFYRDALGLHLVSETPFALVFDVAGTMLRVAIAQTVTPARQTVLGWEVTDIAATVDDLTGRGVVFTRYDGMDQDARGIWTSPAGGRIAWFLDPDGNVLSLTQFE
jgi:catechol 2,3-dioxygenase-like lactoylglutathione lyase family enzyme